MSEKDEQIAIVGDKVFITDRKKKDPKFVKDLFGAVLGMLGVHPDAIEQMLKDRTVSNE